MPIQLLPKEGSFGQTFGTGLGQGLGQLFGGLAQGKAKQRVQQKEESALEPLLGQQSAHAIAHASPDIKRYLLQSILKGMQGGENNQKYADYLEKKGIDPEEFMSLPKNVQNMELKNKLNPGFWKNLGNWAEGRSPSSQDGLRQSSNPTKRNEISKEQAEELRSLGYDVPLPDESTPLGQLLSSGAIGVGSGIAALRPEFLGQNLASLGTSGINWLGKLLGAENNILTPYEELSAGKGDPKLRALYEQLKNSPEGSQEQELLKNPSFRAALMHKEGPQGLLPTSSQFTEAAKELTRGTPLEKYAIPQTQGQEKAERLGNAFSVIANPAKTFDVKNIAGTVKTAAKAAGITLAGDAAGWMAEQATGSKKIGEIVRNGAWILGSIFPGTFGKMAENKYGEWDEKVANKAAQENKFINMTELRKDPNAEKLFDNIQRMVKGSEAQQFVGEEAVVLENLLNNTRATPQAIKDYISELGKMTKKASTPDQAKKYIGQMKDLLQNKLYKFSDEVTSGGAQMLKDADRLYATNQGIWDLSKNLKKSLNKTVLLTPFLLFSGGYKLLGAAAAGGVAGRYISKLLNDPVSRKIISDLSKQSAGGNATQIQKSFEMLDKRGRKLSPKDYKELATLRNKSEK